MADKMMFPLGFDLEQAVKDAEKDFEKVIGKLQRAADNEPINLSVKTDVKSIDAAGGSISKLREEMARLSKQWESMPNIDKFNGDKLTDGAQKLIQEYAAASASLERYGQSLQGIVSTQKQAAAEQERQAEAAKKQSEAQDKQRYNEWLRQKNQEAIEHERVEKQKQAATAKTIAEQNKEFARQEAAEQKRQAAIAASLRSEYKKIEIKRQSEAASKRELEMLNAQYRAEEARNRLARQDERIRNLNRLRTVLQAEENSIAKINAKLQVYRQRLQSTEIGSRQFNQTVKEIDRLSAALDRTNKKIQTLSTQSANGSRRLASAANETSRAYASTEGYITRLLKRTAVLFGIAQVTRFAQRVREVTAEFELQRVSLGAIIQDTERANALFNQIKTFAIQSPFEIKDLVGYVKQLSAYRIETDKLFDTTKRLADVSAGLGVDMGRLILAYGQVKAASVLRGCLGYDTEVRTTDGTKKVQDVKVGDGLLNENGEVVNVKELIRGREQMYRVVQSVGMEYRVNENHILTLYKDGALHDIYVKDYDDTYMGVRNENGRLVTYSIDIYKDAVDDYYGFVLDGNRRFQLGDGTITHNTEVRQFTEAGIPLIQLLADKFTALRGEVVSTSEVFDLISKRAVSFEMVAEIFEDMTNAGGMFYNMQEKQARTLAGQWSNLKDSLSIMYDEMGRTASVQSAMKGLINATKTLAENWRLVRDYTTLALGGFAIVKAKSMWDALGAQMFATTQKATAAQERYNAAVAKQNALLPTATNLERAAAAQKVRTASAALKSARALEAAAASTNRLAFAWKKLSTFMKANWLSIAISALVSLGLWISNAIRKSNELKNALRDIGTGGAKNIAVMTRNFEVLANKAVSAADGSREQKNALDELERTYRDMIPTHKLTINNLREMAGNYGMLTEAIREYISQQTLSNQIETIIGNTTEKVSKAQESLRKKLQGTKEVITTISGDRITIPIEFDERTIERAFAGIEHYARTTADDVQTIIRKAFKDFAGIDLSYEQVKAISELGGLKTNVESVVNAYREQEEQIRKVTEQQREQNGSLGIYAGIIDEVEKKIKGFTSGKYAPGTFAFNEEKAKSGAEDYLSVIRRVFQDSGLTFDDAWVDGKYIDIPAITKALIDAGNKVSSSAHKAFEKVANAYYELVPSDVFSKAINAKFKEVADGIGVSMDLIQRHLKKDDTGINEFVDNFFKDIDDLELRIQQTKALLTSKNLSESERTKKSADLRNYEQELAVMKAMLPYIKLFRIEKDKGGDDRLSKLKEEVSLLEKVYAKYREYTKYVSASDAQERINREFGKTLDVFRKYGIELPKTSKEYQEALKKLQDVMSKLPKSQKDVLELGFKIENVDWEDTKENLEDGLKRLADDVSKTKTAKEFFNRMLNLTGDVELSASVTMSVYGDTGEGLFEKMKEQIVRQFGEFDVTLAFDTLNEVIDYNKLEELYGTYRDKIPEKYREGIEKMIADNRKLEADNVRLWTEQLAKAKDFEQRRTDIVRQETERRIEILKSGLKQDVKDAMIQQSRDTENKELAKINVEELKASEDYIKSFQNLDKVSNATIDRLIANMEMLIEKQKQLGGEDTINMKTLIESLEKLKGVKMDREDPLAGMIQSVQLYIEALKKKKQAELDYATAAANYELDTHEIDLEMNEALKEKEQIQANIVQAENEELLAKQQLQALEDSGASPEEIALAEQQVASATALVTYEKEKQENTEKRIKKLGEDRLRKEKELGKAEKDITDAEDEMEDAQNGFKENLQKSINKAQVFKQAFDGLKEIATEFFGVAEDSDFAVMMDAASKSMQLMQTIFGVIIALQTIFNMVTAKNPYMAIAMAVLAVATAIASVIANQKVKNANREIAKQQQILDALEKSYKRLQKEADKLFGGEYVNNIREQQELIRAQIEATEKQLEAEQSKGKKTDDDKVKEYQDDIDDLKDDLKDLTTTISETMLGTDLASAAKTFAQSWLDAYNEFGDTRKAIEGEMKTLMQNLIVQSVLAAVMKKALEPVFELINNMGEGDFYSEDFWKKVIQKQNEAVENGNAGAQNWMNMLEQWGVKTRELGSGLSGISKDIATASEESILGLAAGINTQNYYISHIDATVSQIAAMLTGGGVDFTSNERIADLITMQNEHLSHLPSIALYTSQTAERCERAARACEDMADNLSRVIKPVGNKGAYVLNTAL